MNTKQNGLPLQGIGLLGATVLVLVAFAANSLLCRSALADKQIDMVGFSVVRLVTGSFALVAVGVFRPSLKVFQLGGLNSRSSPLLTASCLFTYCFAFSAAYITIDAGIGALILFGAVQATMMFAAVLKREALGVWQWCGLALAFGGLAVLVLSGDSAATLQSDQGPGQFLGCASMFLAGVAWAIYTLLGRGSSQPVALTAQSFWLTIPLCCVAALVFRSQIHWSLQGLTLATLSGVVTSALGYALWYRVLPNFTRSQAAILQLIVPLLAALGGVLLLAESLSIRLVIGGVFILGGILLNILCPKKTPRN